MMPVRADDLAYFADMSKAILDAANKDHHNFCNMMETYIADKDRAKFFRTLGEHRAEHTKLLHHIAKSIAVKLLEMTEPHEKEIQ